MKIIYIITGLSVGGAERITVDLAERMALLGNDVELIFLSGEQLVSTSKRIKVFNLRMKKSVFGLFSALCKVAKIIKDFKPDVVHANMFHAILFARIIRIFVKVPRLISSEHSNNFHGKIRQVSEHVTDFLTDVNTNVSELATQYFIQKRIFSKNKTVTVYNGIDLERFYKNKNFVLKKELNIPDDNFVFINISRFNEAKDHETLINAFNVVHKKNPNTKLVLVGDGELSFKIKTFVQEKNLADSVIFTGIKNNTQDYYNVADCFVLSSVWEGFGLVLVEAMACELEVISTDCGGTKEILSDSNMLVPIKNPKLLAAKMLEVAEFSLEKRLLDGKNNRKTAEKFDLKKITNDWLKIYHGDNFL